MNKLLSFLIILLLIMESSLSYGGNIPMPTGRTCDGSQLFDGTFIPAGQVREITYGGVRYRCVGCGDCTPISSGSSGSSSSSTPSIPSYGTTSQQIAIGLMGAFLSGFFSSLMSGIFDDDSAYTAQKQREYEEQQRKKYEEEKRKQEEHKKQLLSQYNTLLVQAKNQLPSTSLQSSSPFSFQTLGSQLTAFQWQSPSSSPSVSDSLNSKEEYLRSTAHINKIDINSILGNVIQEKITEKIEEKIEDYGGKLMEKLDKKYGKEWGSKFYEKGLPIIKIAVTAKTEGIPAAGAETINYGISLLPMPTIQSEISDIGRKIYTKIAFSAIDMFLTETERAAEIHGLNFNKEEFLENLENDMNIAQKIIYKWLRGD